VVFAEAVGAAACASLVAVRVINYQGVLRRLRKTRRCEQKEFPLCVRAAAMSGPPLIGAASKKAVSKLDPHLKWPARPRKGPYRISTHVPFGRTGPEGAVLKLDPKPLSTGPAPKKAVSKLDPHPPLAGPAPKGPRRSSIGPEKVGLCSGGAGGAGKSQRKGLLQAAGHINRGLGHFEPRLCF
jgi:hypothetical protein